MDYNYTLKAAKARSFAFCASQKRCGVRPADASRCDIGFVVCGRSKSFVSVARRLCFDPRVFVPSCSSSVPSFGGNLDATNLIMFRAWFQLDVFFPRCYTILWKTGVPKVRQGKGVYIRARSLRTIVEQNGAVVFRIVNVR